MLKLILFIFMLFLTGKGFSQSKKKKIEEPVPGSTVSPYGRVSNLPLSTRLKIYPFKNATQIQLASFDNSDGQVVPGTKMYNNTPKLPIRWKTPFFQTKILDKNSIDKLTDLLYNFDHFKSNYISEHASCFNPKNAILFLDEKGEVFDIFTICFECQRIETYNNKISLPCTCDHTVASLKTFFKKEEIKYGVINK